MTLVIAEKKVLAEQIAEAVNAPVKRLNPYTVACDRYTITFLGGHVLTHVMPEEMNESYKKWTLQALPIYFFPWRKKPIKEKAAIFNNVKEFLKKADTVIHAGDMDDEGQLLVDEVLDFCGYKGSVKRLQTADTTPAALRRSLGNLTENNKLYGNSAEARSVSDLVFGFTLSRYFSIKTNTTLHIGRVKCPTLGLVYKRDQLIDNFRSVDYFIPCFTAKSASEKVRVKVEFPKDDEILDMSGYLTNKDKAEAFVKEHNEGCFKGETRREPVVTNPPMPFNLANLQLHCEKIFGYTPSKTLEITQQLRDKYNAITYNRSECEYLPESYYDDFELFLKTRKTLSLADEKEKFAVFNKKDGFKASCFNSSKVQLHFAIIPQNVDIDLSKFTEEEKNVYVEIARRFLMQFAGPAEAERATLTIRLEKGRKAVAKSLLYSSLGWKALVKEQKPTEEEKTFIRGDDETWFLTEGSLTNEKTKPAARYTEATLIADMTRISKYVDDPKIKELLLKKDEGKTGDKGSIGTSATRHIITADLIKEGYLEKTGKNGKQIKTTDKGKALYKLLPENCKTADITAEWFIIQEEITKGRKQVKDLTEKVMYQTKETMKNDRIDFQSFTAAYADPKKAGATAISSCSCGGDIRESEKSWYCTSCKHVVSKDDKFFKAIGAKMTKTAALEILKNGKIAVKAHSKTKDKDYIARIVCSFDESKKTPKGWIYPQYKFETNETNKI